MVLRPSLLPLAAALALGALVAGWPAPAANLAAAPADAGVAVTAGLDGDEPLHFRLERTEPAADTVLPSPGEVRLWFSQGAQEDATSIRVLDAAGEPVSTGDLWSSEARDEHAVELPEPLSAGVYTVAWRSMAADGHVVRGDFRFTVQAQE